MFQLILKICLHIIALLIEDHQHLKFSRKGDKKPDVYLGLTKFLCEKLQIPFSEAALQTVEELILGKTEKKTK